MSKTVGTILTIAAVVVAVASGVGAISAATAALISAGIAVATLANSAVLASKAKSALQERQASVINLSLGEVSREALFGLGLTGGSLVDAFNWGGKYGTDWECRIIALADHRCEALTGFYVNDVYVPFAGNGAVAGYGGQLEVYWCPGTETQAVPAVVLAHGPGWTANDNGAGVSWVAVCYKADASDAKNPIWTVGRPTFAWLLKGRRCYQARKDSSVGGAGSHRWADPATWEWTDNLIDCRYNWVRGTYACDRINDPGQLLVGRGLSTIEAPPANVFAPANLCDELVALDAGGTEKRYTVNGVVRADEPYIQVEEHFAAACGGVIVQPEGAVEIEPGQAKAPVFFFSDDDLIVGSSVAFSEDLSEQDDAWVNTVVPRYVEPTQKYADHAAPIRRLNADVIADGGPREQSLSLMLVASGTQAGRVGEIARRLGRLWRRGKVTLGPGFAEVEEGDWGVWTSQRYLKGASVLFRVEGYSLDEKWHNTLTLREISKEVYDRDADVASTSVALKQNPPAIGAPGAGAWTLAAGTLSDGQSSFPSLVITGGSDNSYAELIHFEYWAASGDVGTAQWVDAGVTGPDAVRREITAVKPLTVYYAAVSYVVGRVPGPRRVLGPITTSAFVGVKGDKGDPGRNNILDTSPWIPGADLSSGTLGRFTVVEPSESFIVLAASGPTGASEPVWSARSQDDVFNDAPGAPDGGWTYALHPPEFDPRKSYRFMVWLRQSGARDQGRLYFGTGGTLYDLLAGGNEANCYFWHDSLPLDDVWYLGVGYVHGSDYTGPNTGLSGIYDPATGKRVLAGRDFRQLPGATALVHRAFQYYRRIGANADFARPSIEEIGQGTYSIEQLFATNGMTAQQAQAFALAQQAIANIVSDDVITAGAEKAQLKQRRDQLVASYDAAYNSSMALTPLFGDVGNSTRSAAIAARVALDTYLNSLAPAWDNQAVDTPCIGLEITTRFANAWTKIATMAAFNEGFVRDRAKAAQDRIAAISADNVLSAGSEKSALMIDYTALYNDFAAIDGRYVALGSPADITTARNSAFDARQSLDNLLLSYNPAWNDIAQDTPINAATFRSTWASASAAISTFAAAITGRKGDKGDSAPLVLTQWSINGVDNWHANYFGADIYFRQSNDNGITWGPAVRGVGADGVGADGISTLHCFLRSATVPSAPATSSGIPPAGWYANPPAGTDYLWMSTGTFRNGAQLAPWGAPQRISGESGSSEVAAYLRSAAAPATPPSNTGAPPSGWYAADPGGSADLYRTTATFVGGVQMTNWAAPQKISGPQGAPGSNFGAVTKTGRCQDLLGGIVLAAGQTVYVTARHGVRLYRGADNEQVEMEVYGRIEGSGNAGWILIASDSFIGMYNQSIYLEAIGSYTTPAGGTQATWEFMCVDGVFGGNTSNDQFIVTTAVD